LRDVWGKNELDWEADGEKGAGNKQKSILGRKQPGGEELETF
jgi:hypothetical protein